MYAGNFSDQERDFYRLPSYAEDLNEDMGAVSVRFLMICGTIGGKGPLCTINYFLLCAKFVLYIINW